MTVDEIHATVAHIRTISDDDEAAHVEEDMLWLATLRAISALGGEAGALALAAIETTTIDFSRWYA